MALIWKLEIVKKSNIRNASLKKMFCHKGFSRYSSVVTGLKFCISGHAIPYGKYTQTLWTRLKCKVLKDVVFFQF